MRILQLIDSLRPGGAEKMAVNIANALLPHVEGSYLCCTRQEGMLKEQIKPGVGYLFLNKKSSLDLQAIFKLSKYILQNNIDIVHAHSTSYFLAGLLKLAGSRFKLVWHDHYGKSENLEAREFRVLKKFSGNFSGIISVNTALKVWATKNLECNNVIEIKNFVPIPAPAVIAPFKLKGEKDDFKIICVANLRPQKDHLNLLQAFEMLDSELKVSLHLIGEDPETHYSASVFSTIKNSPVKHKIFYYGCQPEIIPFLKQAHLGLLSSRSEGLPLALIEYGMAGLPVICTSVGECSSVVGDFGVLIPSENSKRLFLAIKNYRENRKRLEEDSIKFHNRVQKEFSEEKVISKFLLFLKNI